MTSVTVALSVVAAGAVGSACGGTGAAVPASSTSTPRATPSSRPPSTGALVAPASSVGDEANYLKDVTGADPALATYASRYGNVALQALVTDGSAFCAFLSRGNGIDDAMVSLAVGARGVEKTTHLPSTVTTYNTIEASALLTLCPSEQSLVPAAVREKIRVLAGALGSFSG